MDFDVRAVADVPGGAQAVEDPDHGRVGRLGVRGQGVSTSAACRVGRMPGQCRADALALAGVGDLQSEVDDALLAAYGAYADEADWFLICVEPDPALRMGEQPRKVAVKEACAAPPEQQAFLQAALMEGIDQVPVPGRHPLRARESRVRQQEQPARASSRSVRR